MEKQPWQMTREEYVGDGYIQTGRVTVRALKQQVNEWQGRVDVMPDSEGATQGLARASRKQNRANEHDKGVQKALSEGKPVPAEVLKDYPDLQATVSKEGEQAETEKQPWEMTKEEFGFGGVNDWPLKISSKGKIYGDAALDQFHKTEGSKPPFFATPEAAQKWVDKARKQLVKQALSEGKFVLDK